MTQEDIELLLTDICARLRYDIKINYEGRIYYLNEINPACKHINYISVLIQEEDRKSCATDVQLNEIKPYLRPMSSMTEEENKELSKLLNYEFYIDQDFALRAENDRHRIRLDLITVYTDFLNSHHFDYRGLIERGLALEAPEDMYK